MEIRHLQLDKNKPYYEVRVWIHGGRGYEVCFFSTEAEAKDCLKKRQDYLKSIGIQPSGDDSIEYHPGKQAENQSQIEEKFSLKELETLYVSLAQYDDNTVEDYELLEKINRAIRKLKEGVSHD